MDIKLLIELPFVGVVWGDASGEGHIEYTPEEAVQKHKASPYITFGHKFMDDEEGITLYNEQSLSDKGLRSRAFIPRGMIRGVIVGEELIKLLKLREPRKARKKNEVHPVEGSIIKPTT